MVWKGFEMVSRVKKCADRGLITPPKWLPDNTHYEVITGSVAYSVSGDTSDMDVVGFCIPKKECIFPHTNGFISGFGTKPEIFEQYQQHHVIDKECGNQEYDFTIYNIVKYFDLCFENNPNMVDTLFVPQRCVLHCTPIAQLVRDNRKEFLSKLSYKKFRGYAYAQLNKIGSGANTKEFLKNKPDSIVKILDKIDDKKSLLNVKAEMVKRGL